MLCDILAS